MMLTKKIWYDQRSVRCRECAFFRPAGSEWSKIGQTCPMDACKCYGYIFHDDRYPGPAEDCDGFKTPSEYAAECEARERQKRQTKKGNLR